MSRKIDVRAVWGGKRRFEACGPTGHRVIMDADATYGGEGKGNSPVELLVMGLAGCMGIDVALILERMRLVCEHLAIDATGWQGGETPHALERITLRIDVSGKIPPSRLRQAVRLAKEKYCTVSASLLAAIDCEIYLNGTLVAEAVESAD
ncbi:OsmC family protein [Brevibacillus fulvus]|uniref:Redox protein n=1 Tax=Brevibacillus fulvus TaxID=1125967 RepID=A0A938XZJ0_9BACL|nr:OsmC family protein [Brevibacillus fulvus]MBM7591114.1 putative redox protein [Brevibacillus fulvus]